MIHAVEVSSIAGYNWHVPIHHAFTAVWRRTEPAHYAQLTRHANRSSEEDDMRDRLEGTSIPARLEQLRARMAEITPKGIKAMYGELEERVDQEVGLQMEASEEEQQEERQEEDEEEEDEAEEVVERRAAARQAELDEMEQQPASALASSVQAQSEQRRREKDRTAADARVAVEKDATAAELRPTPSSREVAAPVEEQPAQRSELESATVGSMRESETKTATTEAPSTRPVNEEAEQQVATAETEKQSEEGKLVESAAANDAQEAGSRTVKEASEREAAERRRCAALLERQRAVEVRERLKDHVRGALRRMYGVEKEKAVIKAMRSSGQIVRRNNKGLHKRVMGTSTPHHLTATATAEGEAAAAAAPRVWMLGGRVDGFVDGELIEIKNRTTHLPHTLPLKDRCQFLVYLHVLGLDSGRLVELIRGGRRYERRKETVVQREGDEEVRLWALCRWHLQRLVDFLTHFMADDERQRAYVAASEAEQEDMLRDVWPIGYVPRYRQQLREHIQLQPLPKRVVHSKVASGQRIVLVEHGVSAGTVPKRATRSDRRNTVRQLAKASKKAAARSPATDGLATRPAEPVVLQQSVSS